jgi:prepilin-type N-terminal cleavage/methylation domain-containing protein
MRQQQYGFTLIELALAMFIIVLLLGSILVPLTTQVEQRQINDTQKILEEIKEALLGFALSNGHLPCPDKALGSTTGPNDTPNDGIEDYTAAGLCVGITGTSPNTFATGNVPWATLGVGNTDPWGNRFRYTVLAAFAQRPTDSSPNTTNFSLTTASNAGLRVCQVAASCATPPSLSSTAIAVIISHGKNGLGAINSLSGAPNPTLGIGTDENANVNGDRDFVSKVQSAIAGNEFDDIVTWVSRYTLYNRMVAAGKLP